MSVAISPMPMLDSAATQRMADRGMPVEFMAADRPGSNVAQVATTAANSTVGVLPVSEAADRNIASLRGAIGNVADDIGVVRPQEYDLGTRVQRGVGSFLGRGEERVSRLYERIPIDPERPAELSNVRRYLADANAGFRSNPALSQVWSNDPKLQQTARALATAADGNGGLSWQDLKAFRSVIGEKIGQPGLASDGTDMRRLRGLYGALSEDMRATASAAGPDALKAFERANAYKRGLSQRTERVFSELLGDKFETSPESSIRTLLQWGKGKGGDAARFAQTFRSLPPEDADSVRATVLTMLGNAPKGRQNAQGDVFSTADFVSTWNALSPRAKHILFGGEHRGAIDDIAQIASGMKASSRFANTSRTGLAQNITQGLGVSGGAGVWGSPVAGVLTLAGQYGLGKLMASPRFARWLVALDKKPNPAAIRAHVQRLGKFSTTGGIQAQEFADLSDRIMQELEEAPGAEAR